MMMYSNCWFRFHIHYEGISSKVKEMANTRVWWRPENIRTLLQTQGAIEIRSIPQMLRIYHSFLLYLEHFAQFSCWSLKNTRLVQRRRRVLSLHNCAHDHKYDSIHPKMNKQTIVRIGRYFEFNTSSFLVSNSSFNVGKPRNGQ